MLLQPIDGGQETGKLQQFPSFLSQLILWSFFFNSFFQDLGLWVSDSLETHRSPAGSHAFSNPYLDPIPSSHALPPSPHVRVLVPLPVYARKGYHIPPGTSRHSTGLRPRRLSVYSPTCKEGLGGQRVRHLRVTNCHRVDFKMCRDNIYFSGTLR